MIVELVTNSYKGYSLGAVHYYAELKWQEVGDDHPDRWKRRKNGSVYAKLTAKDAKRHNAAGARKFQGEKYKAGDTAFGYLTEQEAIDMGVKKFLKAFDPERDVLILGESGYIEPHLVLHGPQELKDTIQAWHDEYQAAEKNGDSKLADKIGDKWWKFWKQYEKTQDNREVKFDEFEGIHDSR